MTAYESLSTEIGLVKSEIAASLAASTYTAQDLVYVASALNQLGGLLGVNDIVQATADKVAELETKKVSSLASLETKRVDSLADINADRAQSLADVDALRVSALNQIASASTSFNVLFIGSMI